VNGASRAVTIPFFSGNPTVLVYRAPQPHGLTTNHDVHLIKVPGLAGRGSVTLDLEGDEGSELLIPLTQGFVADHNAALKKECLHGAQTEVEAIHQPEGVVNHGGEEAILGVPSGMGQVSGSAGITSSLPSHLPT
jgi:hypothetical protein